RSVTEATPIEDALAMMVAGPTRRVIVVDPGGRLAGILSVDDVVALLAEEMRVIGRLLERQEPVLPPLVSTDRARSIGSGSAAA
ncbi:MAG TPA: CBS domain-containing protein, partial [Longimicrobiales bacterium]|nr:CBS domain-containing protein [Longimicrobiales bacterium]